MSPKLEYGVSIPINEDQKFVRKGNDIAFEAFDKCYHRDIANEYNLLNKDGTVDDAGSILYNRRTDTFVFIGKSQALRINGDSEKAREKTGEIAKAVLSENANIRVKAPKP